MSSREIAEGFISVAVANMAKAIKQISIERGHDVTRYTLVAFGGAAGSTRVSSRMRSGSGA